MQNAVVAFVAVLLGVAIVEGLLRVFAPQAIYAIQYCYLGWCHVPGVSFVHGGASGEFVTHVRYNSRGLRDREYSLDKPAGSRRVLIFGDSFAEGLEVELEDLHAKRLERMLGARYPGNRVEVINFGVSAYDTAQEWWYLKTEGVRYQADLVVVLWTGESGSPFVRLQDGHPVFVEPRYTRTEVWVRNARTFLKLHFHTATLLMDRLGLNRSLHQFLGRGASPALADPYGIPHTGLPVLPFSREWETQMAIFEDFSETARRHGAKLVVATHSSHGFRYLTEATRLQPIPGLIVVDLQRVSDRDEARYRFPRDGHYNPLGHEKAARILFDLIVERDLLALGGSRTGLPLQSLRVVPKRQASFFDLAMTGDLWRFWAAKIVGEFYAFVLKCRAVNSLAVGARSSLRPIVTSSSSTRSVKVRR